MKINLVSLAIAGATFASASVMFSANPAQAFDITYDWRFSPRSTGYLGFGTFVSDSETGLLSSITGVVVTVTIPSVETKITGLLPERDSKIPLGAIYFEAEDGKQWEIIKGTEGPYVFQILTLIKTPFANLGSFDYTPQAVPEPLTILGSGIALGFGGFLKCKLGKHQKD